MVQSMNKNFTKSFYDWCIKNNRQDLFDRWDYKLNKCSPKDVGISSGKHYYFQCPKGNHNSQKHRLADVTRHNLKLECDKCNSFAQYNIDKFGDDFLIKYWDWDKNEGIDPWKITYNNSAVYIWIKCQEKSYHNSYRINCSNFNAGYRCSYCKCNKVHRFDSLGWLHPEVFKYWSDKNQKSPYEYAPYSNKKVWWKCIEGKHEDYLRAISNLDKQKFRCPKCVEERNESILQEKVRKYLENLGYKVNHEFNCELVPISPKTKLPMPFDNEVIIGHNHLIVEVNGIQHYDIYAYSGVWKKKGTTPEQQLHKQQLHDRYKKYVAYYSGYFYMAIPYWTDDKDELYKALIDNKINEISNIKQLKAS